MPVCPYAVPVVGDWFSRCPKRVCEVFWLLWLADLLACWLAGEVLVYVVCGVVVCGVWCVVCGVACEW